MLVSKEKGIIKTEKKKKIYLSMEDRKKKKPILKFEWYRCIQGLTPEK